MALFFQEQLLITCDTLREIIWSLIDSIEWSNHDRMNSCDSCRHCLCLRTEHIHVSIKDCHIIRCGNSIHAHLTSAVAFWLILLNNLSPEHTSSTELCNLHKVVLGNTHVELNLVCCKSRLNTCINQLLKILVTPSKGIAEFLNDIGSRIVE